MAISDKNRKILWARSGNQCAICRVSFVVEKTPLDPHSVVGEECHIVSASPDGPRHDPAFKPEQFDALENIILLCPTNHKMVDDQPETYTADILRRIKANHEKWVESKLREKPESGGFRIHRIAENIPKTIPRIKSAQDLLAMAGGVYGQYFNHDDDLSGEETEAVGMFIQELTDWVDCCSDMEPLDRVRGAARFQKMVNELEKRGFFVFATQEVQRMEGGVGGPEPWPMLHISVLRISNPIIQYQDVAKSEK